MKTRIGTLLPVAVGAPIPFEALAPYKDRQELADFLRAHTYALSSGTLPMPVKMSPGRKLIVKLKALRPKKRAA